MSTPETPAAVVDASQVVAWLSQLRVDVAETVGGVLLRGARPVQVGTTDGATARPATSAACLVGFSLYSPDGAIVRLYDGEDNAGDLVAVVDIPVDGSTGAQSQWFGPGGLNLARGLYVDVTGGVAEGAVYLRGAE